MGAEKASRGRQSPPSSFTKRVFGVEQACNGASLIPAVSRFPDACMRDIGGGREVLEESESERPGRWSDFWPSLINKTLAISCMTRSPVNLLHTFAGRSFIAQYSWGFTMASVVAVLVFCPLISALAFNAPAATPIADALKLLPQVEIPQPTEAPSLELHRRQSNVQYSLLEGPDSVCGYQYGQSSKCQILTTIPNCPKTDSWQGGELGICGTSRCGFATAAGEIGEIICYGPTKTAPRYSWTSCIGGTRVSSCLADSACSDNPGIAIWYICFLWKVTQGFANEEKVRMHPNHIATQAHGSVSASKLCGKSQLRGVSIRIVSMSNSSEDILLAMAKSSWNILLLRKPKRSTLTTFRWNRCDSTYYTGMYFPLSLFLPPPPTFSLAKFVLGFRYRQLTSDRWGDN